MREIPDEQFGFGAFDGVVLTPRDDAKPTKKAAGETPGEGRSHATVAAPAADEEVRDLAAERAARAQRREQERDAKKAVAEAAKDLTAADRKVSIARAAVKDAEKQLRLAEEQRAAADRVTRKGGRTP